MMHENEMELVFESRSINEGFARVAVAAFLTQLNPTLEEVSDVKTAVSEAVTNAIIHGYENEVAKIWIRCQLQGQTLYIEVEDHGKGIEDIEKAMEPLYTTKSELERSGMGFSFMEAFMDKIEVISPVPLVREMDENANRGSVLSGPDLLGEDFPAPVIPGTLVKMEKTIGKGRELWTTQSL